MLEEIVSRRDRERQQEGKPKVLRQRWV